jgi:hypothetical protein
MAEDTEMAEEEKTEQADKDRNFADETFKAHQAGFGKKKD